MLHVQYTSLYSRNSTVSLYTSTHYTLNRHRVTQPAPPAHTDANCKTSSDTLYSTINLEKMRSLSVSALNLSVDVQAQILTFSLLLLKPPALFMLLVLTLPTVLAP